MKIFHSAVVAATLLLCIPALAQESIEKHIKIAIDDGSGPVEIDVDGAGAFDPSDLQVGESRSIVDQDGRTVLFTRTADGLEVTIDGETIDLPAMHGAHAAQHGGNMDVRVMRMHGSGGPGGDAITILSGKPLDESVKETIRSALVSAGETRQVVFIDEDAVDDHAMMIHGSDDGKQVKIISRKVVTTN